jgi:hypothetical protein
MSRNLCPPSRTVSEGAGFDSDWQSVGKGVQLSAEPGALLSLIEEALQLHQNEALSTDEGFGKPQLDRLIAAVCRLAELSPESGDNILQKLVGRWGIETVSESLLDTLAEACACLYTEDHEEVQNMAKMKTIGVFCLGAIAHLMTALLSMYASVSGSDAELPPALLQTVQALHDILLILPSLAGVDGPSDLIPENRLRDPGRNRPSLATTCANACSLELERPHTSPGCAAHLTEDHGDRYDTMGGAKIDVLKAAEVLVIQDSISEMCESFWNQNWTDRHVVAPHMTIFLLRVALGMYGDIDISAKVSTENSSPDTVTQNRSGFPGRPGCGKQTSLREDAVRRIHQVRHAFFCLPIDQVSVSLAEIESHLQRGTRVEASEVSILSHIVSAFENTLVVQNPFGRKWLALCLSGLLSQMLTELCHNCFQERIIYLLNGKRLVQHYAEVYFRAWSIAHAAAKENQLYIQTKLHFERVCLQDLAEKSILTASPRLVRICRRILSAFHAQKHLPGVDHALACCYDPIIYRALMRSTNSAVRRNACYLFFEAFPILREDHPSEEARRQISNPLEKGNDQDNHEAALWIDTGEEAAAAEDVDTQLFRQFSLLPRLLLDCSPTIRKVAIEGTCRLLSIFWEIFPSSVRTQLLHIITGELAFDMSSAAVRESVCRSIRSLLESQPLAHPVLRAGILARLRPCFHDRKRIVQEAAAELVLSTSRAPNLRWYDVVSLQEDLAPYLVKGDTIDGRIACLLLPSFFLGIDGNLEEDVDPARYAGTLARCLEFVRTDADAASNFYAALGRLALEPPQWTAKFPSLHLPCISSVCKFVVILAKALFELVGEAEESSEGFFGPDSNNASAREFLEPLFMILCETYRGIAHAVYTGDNEHCKIFLEQQLPLHLLFAIVDALPTMNTDVCGTDAIEHRSMAHLWRLLSVMPKYLVDELSEDCLKSIAEAMQSQTPCERLVPAVEALVGWGLGAELLGPGIALRRLSELLETTFDSDESLSRIDTISSLVEWVFSQPLLRRKISGDGRAMRSCRALQALLTRFLDATESIQDCVRLAAADLLARIILFFGLEEDLAFHQEHPESSRMNFMGAETSSIVYRLSPDVLRNLSNLYSWAQSSITSSHALFLLGQQGASYLSEAITLCILKNEIWDETLVDQILGVLKNSSPVFLCRVGWHLLDSLRCESRNSETEHVSETLLGRVTGLVMNMAATNFQTGSELPTADSGQFSTGEQMLVRKALLRLLLHLYRKRKDMFISTVTSSLIDALREEYSFEGDQNIVAPLDSIWGIPRYGGVLRALLECNRSSLRPKNEDSSQALTLFASSVAAEILHEFEDPHRSRSAVANPNEALARLQVLCACAAAGGIGADKLTTVEIRFADLPTSRSLLSVLRLRVAGTSRR